MNEPSLAQPFEGEPTLAEAVEAVVADIPPGRVMTYADVAAFSGHPGAARRVGAVARDGSSDLPWHRVVASRGRLATEHAEPLGWQATALAGEGLSIHNGHVEQFEAARWFPEWAGSTRPEPTYSPHEVALMVDQSASTILRRIADDQITAHHAGTYFHVGQGEVVRYAHALMDDTAATLRPELALFVADHLPGL